MARKARVLRVLLALSFVTVQQITFCGWTSRPVHFTGVRPTHRKAGPSTSFGDAAKPETVFDQIFEEFKPDDVYNTRPGRQDYLQRLEANNLAIIDRVNCTMTHEVIDFDAKHSSNLILHLSADEASPKKSFLATVRGSGGGKTRALEELRWELLGMEGVLPLAFTYNSAMELDFDEFDWSNNFKLNYAMTVVARLATVFYGKPLDEVLDLLEQRAWAGGRKYPLQLIRGFIALAVKKLSCRRGIHTVAILADEVARAEEAFVNQYNLGASRQDVTSILRQAILDQEILPGLQATLVISSLTLSPLGASPSGRYPHVLELAERLNATKVAASWWQRAADDDVATFIAAALSDLPRLLEFAAEFFKEQPKKKKINHTEVKEVFQHVRERLKGRYGLYLPKADALYPAIFGEETEQDEDVLSLILVSVYVNSVTNMRQSGKLMIEPVPSLFMLSAAAMEKAQRQRRSKDRFAQLAAKFPDDISLTNEGRPLEWCVTWWLRMRLAAAAGKQKFPLAKLLGVEKVDFNCTSESQLDQLEAVTLNIPQSSRFVPSESLKGGKLPNSRQNAVAFLDALQRIPQNPRNLWLLQSADGEAWDIFFAALDTFTHKWFIAFLELKATGSLKSRSQAQHVEELAVEARKRNSTLGLLEALKERRYCFLYITTAKGQSEADELAIVLKEEDTAGFFGPLAAVHKAIRQAFPAFP